MTKIERPIMRASGPLRTFPNMKEEGQAKSKPMVSSVGRSSSFLDERRALRVVFVWPEGTRASAQASALAKRQDLELTTYGDLLEIRENVLERADVLLLWLETVERLQMPALLRLARLVRLVLAVEQTRFLASARYLEQFDAPLFVDMTIERQIAALRMAALGYLVLPDTVGRGIAFDNLRLEAAHGLGARELTVLMALKNGDTNRTIGEALGLSESTVKSCVRAVLGRLQFRNRTEAALFAVRNEGELRALQTGRPARI